MILSLNAKLLLACVTSCAALTALPSVSLATVRGVLADAVTAGLATDAATTAILALVVALLTAAAAFGGAGIVAFAAAGAVGAAAWLAVGSCFPQAPSSSKPASAALYGTAKRDERVMWKLHAR